MPHVLVAPSDDTTAPDERRKIYGDRGGWYYDGAYTGAPVDGYGDYQNDYEGYEYAEGEETHINAGGGREEGGLDQDTEEELDAQEVYYTALLKRFNAFRNSLLHPPLHTKTTSNQSPSTSLNAATDFRSKQSQWGMVMRFNAPTAAHIATLSQEGVIKGLERVDYLLSKRHLVHPGGTGRTLGAWAWALLAKCRELGQMRSEEVSTLRELGRKAGRLRINVRARMIGEQKGELTKDEEEDDDEEEEESSAGATEEIRPDDITDVATEAGVAADDDKPEKTQHSVAGDSGMVEAVHQAHEDLATDLSSEDTSFSNGAAKMERGEADDGTGKANWAIGSDELAKSLQDEVEDGEIVEGAEQGKDVDATLLVGRNNKPRLSDEDTVMDERQGDNMPRMEQESSSIAIEEKIQLELAKRRSLLALNNHTTTPTPKADIKDQAYQQESQGPKPWRLDCEDSNGRKILNPLVPENSENKTSDSDNLNIRALATLDIIITIVGEVFGQRDLLDAREVWGEYDQSE